MNLAKYKIFLQTLFASRIASVGRSFIPLLHLSCFDYSKEDAVFPASAQEPTVLSAHFVYSFKTRFGRESVLFVQF